MRQGVSEAKRDAFKKNERKKFADLLGMTTQELEEELKGKGFGSVGRRLKEMKSDEAYSLAGGGLAEATAKLKAKGMKDGGMVVKEKIVAIDTSPNSGLITTKGFGAGRKT